MGQQDYILRIDNPCREEWTSMRENDKGRFCSHCSHSVVDFTKLTDKEIRRIVETSSGKLCGRFLNQQLDRIIEGEKVASHLKLRKIVTGILLIGGILKSSYSSSQAIPKTEVVPRDEKESTIIQTNSISKVQDDTLKNVIQGMVLDSAQKEPLPGVSIIIKGSEIGVLTDLEGQFTLKIPDSLLSKHITLLVRYIGFRTFEKTIETKELPINVKFILTPSLLTLGEVCIIKKKKWWQFWK